MEIKKMKKAQMFAAALMMCFTLSLASCDDNNEPKGEILTAETMYGAYTGTFTAQTAVTQLNDEAGTTLNAEVANDTIYFSNFPINDIVMTIMGDEAATDAIVEAVGNVSYKLGYTPTVVASTQSIAMNIAPEPLVLNISIPADDEQVQTLTVTVEVSASSNATYTATDGKMQFAISVDKVLLGTGDQQTELPNYSPLNLSFDMSQSKATQLPASL
ncbi:MAG: DUF4840 domain-containing protein [Muribaculaceae bacterium]